VPILVLHQAASGGSNIDQNQEELVDRASALVDGCCCCRLANSVQGDKSGTLAALEEEPDQVVLGTAGVWDFIGEFLSRQPASQE
jgi:G3E family GTPase